MRQIYSAVQMMFIAIALAAIGSVITNIESLSLLGSLMSLAGGVMTIAAVYHLRHENRHFSKALRLFWIYLGLTVLIVFIVTISFASALAGGGLASMDGAIISLLVLLVIAIAVLVLALMMQYQLYAGFEELREVRQLDYPPKRILWCFYLALISTLASLLSVTGISVLIVNSSMGGDAALAAAADTITMAGNIMLVLGVAIEAIHLWLIFTYLQAVKSAMERGGPENWA